MTVIGEDTAWSHPVKHALKFLQDPVAACSPLPYVYYSSQFRFSRRHLRTNWTLLKLDEIWLRLEPFARAPLIKQCYNWPVVLLHVYLFLFVSQSVKTDKYDSLGCFFSHPKQMSKYAIFFNNAAGAAAAEWEPTRNYYFLWAQSCFSWCVYRECPSVGAKQLCQQLPACRQVFDHHTESPRAAPLLTLTSDLYGAKEAHNVPLGTR